MQPSSKITEIKIFFKLQSPSLVQIAGLLLLCLGISIFSAAIQSVEIKSDAQLSEHWRGKYDILVRPETSVSAVETETHLVEGNYLGISSGGITDEQYTLIRSIPGVEVAAPVATVGFFATDTGTLNVILHPWEPDMLYKISWEWHSDGDTVQNRDTQVAYFAAQDLRSSSFVAAGNPSFTDVLANPGKNSVILSVGRLPPQWVLVAGIDPEQEARLTDLEQAVIQGEYLQLAPLSEGIDPNQNAVVTKIPLLVNRQSYASLSVKLKVEEAPLEGQKQFMDLLQMQTARPDSDFQQTLNAFIDQHGSAILEQTLDATDRLIPLLGQSIQFSTDSEPVLSNENGAAISSTMKLDAQVTLKPGNLRYVRMSSAPFQDQLLALEIQPTGRWKEQVQNSLEEMRAGTFNSIFLGSFPAIAADQPVYRPLEPRRVNEPFLTEVKGIYDIRKVQQNPDPLTYAPLGIYDPPEAILEYDTSGNAIPSKMLLPGLNPGNFIPRPPLALTTLQAAKLLSDKSEYINAIRIRVSGIESYSPASLQRVEDIAGQIRQRTGLHVDVIAGASPQRVRILVPEVGYVQEKWTTLGAVQQITQGITAADSALLIFLLVTAGVFVAQSTRVSLLARTQETGLLLSAGWRYKDLYRSSIAALVVTGLTGSLISIGFSVVLTLALGFKPALPTILLVSLLVPLVYILAGVPVVRSSLKKAPVELLQKGEFDTSSHTSWNRNRRLTSFQIFLHLFTGRKVRSRLNGFTFSAGIAFLILVINILTNLQQILQVTLLGNALSLSLNREHTLLIVIAFFMSLTAMYENLALEIQEREGEFRVLYATGWKQRDIARLIFDESIFISTLAGIPGALIGTLSYVLLFKSLTSTTWAIFIGGILLSICAGGLIAIPPVHQVIQSLRGNRTPANVRRVSAVVLLSLVVLSLAILLVWGGRKEVVDSWFSLPTTAPAESNPNDPKINTEKMMQQVEYLTASEADLEDPVAAQSTSEKISQTLLRDGLAPTTEWVPLQAITLFDGKGNALLEIPDSGSLLVTMQGAPNYVLQTALHFDHLANLPDHLFPVVIAPSDVPSSSGTDFSGQMVLLTGDNTHDCSPLCRRIGNALHQTPELNSAAILASLELPAEASDWLLTQSALYGKLTMGEVVSVTIPGTIRPDKEIWIVTQSGSRSPGANQNAAGSVSLLEAVRLFQDKKPAYTLRFIFLPGVAGNTSGLNTYLQLREEDAARVTAVYVVAQTGKWEQLSYGQVLSVNRADTISQLQEPTEDLSRYDAEGQFFLRRNWQAVLDLDRSELTNWVKTQQTRRLGYSESPEELRDSVRMAGEAEGVSISPTNSGCPIYLAFLLSANLPAAGICGLGDDLAGTEFDTAAQIQPANLRQATLLLYQSILNTMGGLP